MTVHNRVLVASMASPRINLSKSKTASKDYPQGFNRLLGGVVVAGVLFLGCTFSSPGFGAEDQPRGPKGGMMKRLDTNGDGQVTRDEFVEVALKRVEKRFNRADTNGDGVLNADELAQMNKQWRARHGRRTQEKSE